MLEHIAARDLVSRFPPHEELIRRTLTAQGSCLRARPFEAGTLLLGAFSVAPFQCCSNIGIGWSARLAACQPQPSRASETGQSGAIVLASLATISSVSDRRKRTPQNAYAGKK
jgi:hypothetical protein